MGDAQKPILKKYESDEIKSIILSFANRPDFSKISKIKLGQLSQEEYDRFENEAQNSWKNICGQYFEIEEDLNSFISKAAFYLKLSNQSLQNAYEVLKFALGEKKEDEIKYEEYRIFLARFGPENFVMKKLNLILNIRQYGYCTQFDKNIPFDSEEKILLFDDEEPNKFIVKSICGKIQYAWNYPFSDYSTPLFVKNQENMLLENWELFFNNLLN